MYRAVVTILISCLLVNPGVFAVPHSHEGTSIVEPAGHDDHPHFHWFDEDQHGESEHQHDSTAVYTGDEQLFRDGQVVKISAAELCLTRVSAEPSRQVTSVDSRLAGDKHTWLTRCNCALYLQFLSIRC